MTIPNYIENKDITNLPTGVHVKIFNRYTNKLSYNGFVIKNDSINIVIKTANNNFITINPCAFKIYFKYKNKLKNWLYINSMT